MWIEREISPQIARLGSTRPVVVVTGARQTGKTSLLRRLFPEHTFVTLDLPATAAQADSDSPAFLSLHTAPVLIDEIQYAPNIFRYLKVDVDNHRDHYGRFILTGSQKFLLMKGVSDSLAGRAVILELETLSYGEIIRSFPDISLNEILLRGGFPELYANKGIDRNEYFRSYLATYLERDVRALVKVASLRDFERFIRACALHSGQLLNRSELARDVGISPSTAGEWLSILVTSGQVFLLEPWFTNKTKSLVKTPKLYWSDVGLLTFLLELRSAEELQSSPLIGAIWESFLCAEMRKRLTFAGDPGKFYFWRDRNKEVDFLIHRGGRFNLFECKWTTTPDAKETSALDYVARELGEENILSRAILCRTETSWRMGNTALFGLQDQWPSRS